MERIKSISKVNIIPNETLIIFDEIQKSERVLNSLKYFCEFKTGIDIYKKYLFLGGMPEVVSAYIDTNNLQIARIKQNEIVETYLMDMTKYNSKADYSKMVLTYNSIPANLAKENKKFMYSSIKKSARAKDYENATEWISLAGIGNKIYKVNQIKIPLETYKDVENFKFYMNDVCLLGAKAKIMYEEIINEEEDFSDFKGGLAENFVISQLIENSDEIYYYKDDKNVEIDFLIKIDGKVIPIEVKYIMHNNGGSISMVNRFYIC